MPVFCGNVYEEKEEYKNKLAYKWKTWIQKSQFLSRKRKYFDYTS